MGSSGEKQKVKFHELLEEAKKRIVLLVVCVVGLSYLMSLTSSSVLFNLPAALFLFIVLRYKFLDFDKQRKAATYKGKRAAANSSSKRKPFEATRVLTERSDWKHKVNSPDVEGAIDQFSRHIVSEWVTDLWYSRITPDRQGPEELVLIINGVFGEISSRVRNLNLIDLLTRDVINLLCCHLEFFRACNTMIEKHQSRILTVEERDNELKCLLAAENKLHPVLFSAEAEHKVLQHVVDGLILFTIKKEDRQCSLFRYITREILACAVLRPVLNLANPRFINERIESLVISANENAKGSNASNTATHSEMNGSPRILSNNISQFPDPLMNGVELVQVKKDENNHVSENPAYSINATVPTKDSSLVSDTRSTRSLSSLPEIHNDEGRDNPQHGTREESGDKLEHFDSMWTKGRNYKRKDTNQPVDPLQRNSSARVYNSMEHLTVLTEQKKKNARYSTLDKDVSSSRSNKGPRALNNDIQYKSPEASKSLIHNEEDELKSLTSDEDESWSSSFTENEDADNFTDLDSPGIKVWDNKGKGKFCHIHHPLETFDVKRSRKVSNCQLHSKRLQRSNSAKKRARSSRQNRVWKDVIRTNVLIGDGQDVLNSSEINDKPDSSEDSESEMLSRICSGETTSSSMSLASLPESHAMAAGSAKNLFIPNSLLKLRCEVLGANIVKSGAKMFTVYSVSVSDVNNSNWSIKRRFRHFEELHRRLKDFPEYNLHLPSKHFWSSGLDILIIQERCILLDQYLKRLLQLPTVSSTIEVWDFLSVDSQMYIFSHPLSIIETLSVREKSNEYQGNVEPEHDQDSASKTEDDHVSDGSKLKTKVHALYSPKKSEKALRKDVENSSTYSENPLETDKLLSETLEKTGDRDKLSSHSVETEEAGFDPTLPSEWVPPNIGMPLLDLVDVILQLKDGGWIRRKAFWVVKQILQLGMGDALNDWLIEKIQFLRQGSVVASGIRQLEQILWPDQIFITKHPRQQQSSPSSPSHDSHGTPYSSRKVNDVQQLEEMQQKEAERRAKFVYELMIDTAPAAVVGLVGHNEYERCAKDLYYFFQSSLCMKLLAFDLLELLLLSVFPELEYVFKQLDEEKEKFGSFKFNQER